MIILETDRLRWLTPDDAAFMPVKCATLRYANQEVATNASYRYLFEIVFLANLNEGPHHG